MYCLSCIDIPLFHCYHPRLVLLVVAVDFEVPLDFKQRTKQREANKRKSRERARMVGESESESISESA